MLRLRVKDMAVKNIFASPHFFNRIYCHILIPLSFFEKDCCYYFFENGCMLCYVMLFFEKNHHHYFFTDKNHHPNFMTYKLYVNIPYVCYGIGG